MLRILRSHYRVRTVVCEGGPRLFRALLEIGAVDELRLTWTPRIFGGAGAPTLTGIPDGFLPKTIRSRLRKMETEGGECFLTYTF
jgi:5-amino-6-(5-phosphoribosylamino)uracil reductase/2,5-diamino-6-(ribosylamino)-4(3H)-pyrimidinone 5'-phosphate reductase